MLSKILRKLRRMKIEPVAFDPSKIEVVTRPFDHGGDGPRLQASTYYSAIDAYAGPIFATKIPRPANRAPNAAPTR
jgi:hypothetical protein